MPRTRRPRIDWGRPPAPPRVMDAGEFEGIRLVLGKEGEPLPQSHLAAALGKSVKTVYRYSLPPDDPEASPVDPAVAIVMRAWLKAGAVVELG